MSESFFASWVLRSTCVIVVGLLALGLLKKASAAQRHFTLFLVLLSLLFLPVFSLLLPAWPLSILPPTVQREDMASLPSAIAFATPVPAIKAGEPVPPLPPLPPPPPIALPSAPPAPPVLPEATISPMAQTVASLPVLTYVVVLAFLLAREVLGWRQLSRLNAESHSVNDPRIGQIFFDSLRVLTPHKNVRLRTHATIPVPMTWGTRHPIVLLPESVAVWSSERLRAVLLHEVAHIHRNDALTQGIVRLICLLYWWHPGVWVLARIFSAETERACDDLVLAVGIGGPDYADHLVAVVRDARMPHPPYPAMAMGRPNVLKARIQAILALRNRQGVSRRGMVLGGLTAFLLLLPFAILHLRSSVKESSAQGTEVAKTAEAAMAVQAPEPYYEPTGIIVAKNSQAVLPNGVRVTHLATSMHLHEDVWEWLPSGEQVPGSLSLSTSKPMPPLQNGNAYSFKLLVNNIPTQTIATRLHSRHSYINFSAGTQEGRTTSAQKRLGNLLMESEASMPSGKVDKIDLDVALALGDGKLIASNPLPGSSSKSSFGPDLKVRYDTTPYVTTASKNPLRVRIQVPLEIEKEAASFRFVVVDKKGKEHTWSSLGLNEDATDKTLTFNELQRGDATDIRVYRTPYQWVRFPDVILQPRLDKWVTIFTPNGSATLPDGTGLTLHRADKGNTAAFTFQFANRNDIEYGDMIYSLQGSDNPQNESSSSSWYGPDKARVEASYNLPLLTPKAAKSKTLSLQAWVASNQWRTVKEYRIADLMKTPEAQQSATQKGNYSIGIPDGIPESLYGRAIRVQQIAPDGRLVDSHDFIWRSLEGTGSLSFTRGDAANTIRIQTAPLYHVAFPVAP